MSITNDQYLRILSRLTKIETTINDIVTAMDAFITLLQVNELLVINTAELQDLREQVDTLESRVTEIEEEPIV